MPTYTISFILRRGKKIGQQKLIHVYNILSIKQKKKKEENVWPKEPSKSTPSKSPRFEVPAFVFIIGLYFSRLVDYSCCNQHWGRSLGGGIRVSLGLFPLSTTKTILSPHDVCTSKWQCINQTPGI